MANLRFRMASIRLNSRSGFLRMGKRLRLDGVLLTPTAIATRHLERLESLSKCLAILAL